MNILNALQGMGPALLDAVGQGVLWGIMVLGVYITYKLLDIADLTVDGSFALGGCVCAMLIVNRGMDPVAALALATLAGMAAGFVTGILHTVFEIPSILAGILTQISLWSINLWIMGNKSNLPLLKVDSMVTQLSGATGLNQAQSSQVIGIIAAVIVVAVLYWFFGTEIGSALRATGNNEDMIRALGVNTSVTKLLALMISNGLVGMSGALVCQSQKYADIQMGTGAIVIGLAAIVIGEVIFGWFRNFACKLAAAVIGSVIYFVIRAVVLQLGLNPNYMKLLSAIIVALALCIPVAAAKWKAYRAYSEGGKS
ncbi:ABC transporter permease [Enterocloster citroniae]